jgi:integrase
MAEVISLVPSSVESVTIEEALDGHLRELEFRKRKPAKLSTLATFKSYRNWIAHVGHIPVAEFNNASMREFIAYLSSEGLPPKTVGEVSSLVKSAIASIVNPETGESRFPRKWNSRFLDAPEIRNQKQPTVTAQELSDVIGAALQAGQILDAALWSLAAGTGARIGELRSLRVGPNENSSFWNPVDATLTIRTSYWRTTEQTPKTQAAHRTVELHESLNNLIKNFVAIRSPKDGDFLFANSNCKTTDVTTLRKHLDTRLPGKGFHSLRRFRARHLRVSGVPDEITKALLGHSTQQEMTSRYSQLGSDAAVRRQWVEKIGLGFDLP